MDNKKNILSKLFIIAYVVSYAGILFISASQLNSLVNNNTLVTMTYTLTMCVGILINIFLIFYSFNKRNMIILFLLTIIFIAPISLFHREMISISFYLLFLFIINAPLVDSESFIKIDLKMRLVMIVTIVLMYMLNLFPHITYVNTTPFMRGGSLRYALGFNHANTLAMFVFSILLSFILVARKVEKRLTIVISLIVLSLVIFKLTNSREFILLALVVLILYYFGNVKFFNKVIKFISYPSFAISLLAGLCFLLASDINSPLFHWINDLTSNRILIQYEAVKFYPIDWVGYVSTPLLDQYKINIDNMYMGYLVRYGIIGFALFILFIFNCIRKSLKFGNYYSNICLILIPLAFITMNTNILFAPMIYVSSLCISGLDSKNTGDKQ